VIAGIRALGRISILKYLFGPERKTETEIIIMLMPRVIRMLKLTGMNLRELQIGIDIKEKITPNDGTNSAPPAPGTAVAVSPIPAATAQPPVAPAPYLVAGSAIAFAPPPDVLRPENPGIVSIAVTRNGILERASLCHSIPFR
jgi:hypothetical protein